MLDITKIQPFDVPPEINVLQKENLSLRDENTNLILSKNIFIGIISTVVLVMGLTLYQLKKHKINDDE